MLKVTGKCHYCHKPCDGMFCAGDGIKESHEVKYMRNRKLMDEHRAAKKREKQDEWKGKGGTLQCRIDAVVLRAYHAGTLMNAFERMQIEQRLQEKAVVPLRELLTVSAAEQPD